MDSDGAQGERGLQRLPLDRSTLAEHAFEAIRSAIVDGRLAAGRLYSVARLAEQFGVSRTPVREALLLLERQGLVRFERNLGVRVLEPSADDVEEVFALRLLLEVPATYRACERLADADLDALQRELDAMASLAERDDESAFMGHDMRYHQILLEVAGNRRLAAAVGALRDFVRLRGPSTVGRGRDLSAIHAEHLAVQAALRRRDPVAAAISMRAHLLNTARLLLEQGGGDASLTWAPLVRVPGEPDSGLRR